MDFYNKAEITRISPEVLFNEGFELSDQQIIPSTEIEGTFDPENNTVELHIYDSNLLLLSSNYDFKNWKIINNSDTSELTGTNTLEITPAKDVFETGYDNGSLFAIYNFINHEISSSVSNPLFISEISSDRTEIRIQSNFISNDSLLAGFNDLKLKLDTSPYFDEFYLCFQENIYVIGVNTVIDTSDPNQFSILVKLYEPLPLQFQLKDELYVVTKVAETQAYQVSFPDIDFAVDSLNYIKGPNLNIKLNDTINNSTTLKTKNDLINTNSSSSFFNLQKILNDKGIKITPNYSYNTFNEFVNFSSAKSRVENFITKVTQIQNYQSDINTLYSITGSTSSSIQIQTNITALKNNIENIIKNFDGYEYYLYNESSSYAYPKSTNSYPYTLYPTTSSIVLNWLGSDNENNISYYGGIILSASLYDRSNQNWLYYTIPEYLREDSDNDQYIEFSNMIGQHFDEIWLYTKYITQKLNSTNNLDEGAPLQIIEDIINSFGIPNFSNNYNNQDNYIGLTGENDGYYLPSTGSELITDYVAINSGDLSNVNYYDPLYNTLLNGAGFNYPIDKVSKEILKRLYHNLSYLAKKKGTLSGLRQLINIWGVPNTILRINEFGGKNADNSDDYDQWYNRYSYAFTPVANQSEASASAIIPYMPLERNRIVDNEYIVPDSIEFRFKTTGIPNSNHYTQSLLVKKSDNSSSTLFDFGLSLYYNTPTTSSNSGSSLSDYNNWGTLKLYISGSSADGGVAVSNDIYLPFFNEDWWSILLQRNIHVSASNNTTPTTYTLYAKNKTYNGFDGNSIGFEASSSIISNTSSSLNEAWNKFGTGSQSGIYLGGYISGSNVGGTTLNTSGILFSGSFQEFRYYSYPINENIFNSYVMNPESIEGINTTGSLNSFDILSFRAPLGNELENTFTSTSTSSYSETLESLHPASKIEVTSLITSSFVIPGSNITSSNYNITYYNNSSLNTFSIPNREVYFLNQPSAGIRNVINNKIQIISSSAYGNTLSNQTSIQQNYQINEKYSLDNNSVEISFSPQDEINDDIIQSLGYTGISNAISDPINVFAEGNKYPELEKIADDYFKKYSKGNIYDYIRLIKYFDNSLFKAIKSYVPARTSVSTGIVIKPHLLERNKYQEPSVNINSQVAIISSNNAFESYNLQNLEITSSIEVGTFTGGTGGVMEPYNYSGSPNFDQINITQSWINSFDTLVGLQSIIENTQEEFYNGELSGSTIVTTTQSLNPDNEYKPSDSPFVYPDLYYIKITGLNSGGGTFYTNDIVDISPPSLTPLITATVKDVLYLPNNIVALSLSNLSGPFPVLPGSTANVVVSSGIGTGTITYIYTIEYSPTSLFNYNDANSLMNNAIESRPNSYLMEVDYNSSITTPTNIIPIIQNTANKASVPDSNYTTRRIINPRYNGSRLQSLDYNNYTPSSSIVPKNQIFDKTKQPSTFLNGDTGSWAGDISYGKTAVIDKHPTYFAYFRNIKENKEYWDTLTCNLEQLIEIPPDLVPDSGYQAKTLKLNGNGDFNLDVSSIFEKGRKASILYRTPYETQTSVKWDTLQTNPLNILQGSSEFQLILGNQIDPKTTAPTCSFNQPLWVADGLYTGSVINNSLVTQSNAFILSGSNVTVNFSGSIATFAGPGLGLLHSFNYLLKDEKYTSIINPPSPIPPSLITTASMFVPPGTEPTNLDNYFILNISSSGLTTYEDYKNPFLIEAGDEIRVNWFQGPTDGSKTTEALPFKTTDFTVTGVEGQTNSSYVALINSSLYFIASGSLYNKILVSPNPATVLNGIPQGTVTRFTIRKKVDLDNRVILNSVPPSGSNGVLTTSKDGFLIPQDITEQQRLNIKNIINNLSAKRAFENTTE